ncbi:MAG: endonuclease III domain-containing protein [Gammaproteobacteria bacterium]|nr:endonuclease III domain-containing protein [Gammaproteobacteria bacterium]
MTSSRRKNGKARPRAALRQVYRRLLAAHGPQHWWPGDTRFEIMVGAVLTQNTAWTNVEKAIANLKRARALTAQAIVAAPHKQLAVWLKPSGYFNVKAKRLKAFCRWFLAQGGTRRLARLNTHDLRAALTAVHGVGPETADDIVLYAFERPVFVIDAYTRRIFARLELIKGNEGYETLRHLFENSLKPNVALFNEYHALIVKHGKDVCRARPWCKMCSLRPVCPSGG